MEMYELIQYLSETSHELELSLTGPDFALILNALKSHMGVNHRDNDLFEKCQMLRESISDQVNQSLF